MEKVGRNDPCPCGSGLKYKRCCMNRESGGRRNTVLHLVRDAGYADEVADVLEHLHVYMKRAAWQGACHASCSALFVALSELGLDPVLCVGEVEGSDVLFDHSWIEIGGKIVDLAISLPLSETSSATNPIIFGKEVGSGAPSPLTYGVSRQGLDEEAAYVLRTPFVTYMNEWPNDKDGLWSVVQYLLPHKTNIDALRIKYADASRQLVVDR